MRGWIQRLWEQLIRDDLFLRCCFLLAGAAIASLGGFFSYKAIVDFGDDRWSALRIGALIFCIAVTGLGLLLASRAFVRRGSRLARYAEQVNEGGNAEALLLIVPVLILAVPLTFVLRLLGVSGQRRDSPSDH